MADEDSLKQKIARQSHWLLGIFIVALGIGIKRGLAGFCEGQLNVACAIAGTLICFLGFYIILRGIYLRHAEQNDAEEK
ncbi:MAG: hypothetical protein K6B46_02790 [Opitutales bacterium]|nr:hypothetical protein [Opitutales bacterium]